MQKKAIAFSLEVYADKSELATTDAQLLEMAINARKKAYAPYSNFFVGAAVLLEDGTMVLGNNQENASYPSGLCAERVAMFHAAANHPNAIIKAIRPVLVAIADKLWPSMSKSRKPPYPLL